MKFRLAAIDLDGTLLTSKKQLTPRSIESLRRAAGNGLAVVLCTGRMVRSAQQYWEQIGLHTPIIGYNGALVRDVERERNLLYRPIGPDLTREILRLCAGRGISPLTYADDSLFVERDTEEAQAYSRTYGVPYRVVPDLPDFLAEGSAKILLSVPPADCSPLAAEMRAHFGDRVNVTQSEGRHVELNHPDATKASAVEFLAGHLRIRREEIIAFGDGINDIEMLQYVGLGLATANAWEEAKRAADRVIGSNDEEAVAAFLDELHSS